jgi:hypothetical protein
MMSQEFVCTLKVPRFNPDKQGASGVSKERTRQTLHSTACSWCKTLSYSWTGKSAFRAMSGVIPTCKEASAVYYETNSSTTALNPYVAALLWQGGCGCHMNACTLTLTLVRLTTFSGRHGVSLHLQQRYQHTFYNIGWHTARCRRLSLQHFSYQCLIVSPLLQTLDCYVACRFRALQA